MSEIPSTLDGRYRLVELLGTGGAAEVWRATDLSTGEEVAVKQLMSSCDDEGARLRREARLLEQLSHSGIARLKATGVVAGRPYLVLDLIPGRTVAQHLEVSGPLEVGEVRALGTQLGRALAYAHDRGVIHRDVKPGNVMVTPDGSAVLVDFGVGRMVGTSCTVTQVGMVTGTIAYLSPEQAAGEAVTAATDIYSLGLVLAEAAAGRRVFDGSATEVTAARMAGDAPLPPELPPALRSLVGPMTRLDPARRPSARRVVDIAIGDPSAVSTAVHQVTATAELEPVDRPTPVGIGTVGVGAGPVARLGHTIAGWRGAAYPAFMGTGDDAGRVDEHTPGVHLAAAAVMAAVLALGAFVGGVSSSGERVGAAEEPPPTAAATTTVPTTVPLPPPDLDDDKDRDKDDDRGNGEGRGHGRDD